MIETERLLIKPLTYLELKLRIENQDKFAEESNLKFTDSKISDEEIDAIKNSLLPNLKDTLKNYLFYTMWLIIEKKEKMVVGGVCFHGEPDGNGEVEIGYGIDPVFQNRGYMKETISSLLSWLRNEKQVKSVIAETEKSNIASVKLLERCGFSFSGNKSNNLIYKIPV